MKRSHVTIVFIIVCLLLGLVNVASAADSWPDTARELIVYQPGGAGGSSDVSSRVMIPYLSKALGGMNIVVKNLESGEMFSLYEEFWGNPVSKEGYAIAHSSSPNFMSYLNPANQNPRTLKDFAWMLNSNTDPSVISVRTDDERFKNVNNAADLRDFIKNSDEPLLACVTDATGDDHVAYIKYMKAIDEPLDRMPAVNFSNGAECRAALMGGHIDIFIGNVGDNMVSMTEDGSVKVIAVMDSKRSPFLPNAPTTVEAGIDCINGVQRGYFAHPDLDPAIREKLTAAMFSVFQDPAYIKDMERLGYQVNAIVGDEYIKFMQKEEQALIDMIPLFEW